jgi:threonine/homoserine/homoserine lactone efflux protein
VIEALAGAVGVLALLTILPGPDMAVVTRSALHGGRRAAAETAAGVVCGLLVWGLLVVAGLAAALATSAGAYATLRLAGAAYLVWLGLRTLWSSRRADPSGAPSTLAETETETETETEAETRRGGRLWRTGLVTNVLNPKIGVFYTSVLPALVPAGAPTTATQAGLVLAHAGLSLAWLNGWAWVVGRSQRVFGRPLVGRALGRASGAVLVGLGLEITARTG